MNGLQFPQFRKILTPTSLSSLAWSYGYICGRYNLAPFGRFPGTSEIPSTRSDPLLWSISQVPLVPEKDPLYGVSARDSLLRSTKEKSLLWSTREKSPRWSTREGSLLWSNRKASFPWSTR